MALHAIWSVHCVARMLRAAGLAGMGWALAFDRRQA